MKELSEKLKNLPREPGIYFYKDKTGEIIYVGKAAVLRNRVRQYFQKSRFRDPKTDALIAEIVDVDWMTVDSELDALFLEAEMIRRYMPKFNILLRDDKSMVYIRIDYDSDFPTVSTTRRPLDDGARYFGPYLSALSVRQALKILRRIFPFATKKTVGQKRETLHYHLGLDPGLEGGKTDLKDYRANLRKLISVIEGKRKSIEKELEKEMKKLSKAQDYEGAAKIRNQITYLQNLGRQVIFSDREFMDISKDHALNELAELLSLYEHEFQVSHADGVQENNEKRASRTNSTVSESRKQLTQQSAASSTGVTGSASQQGRTLRLLKRIEGYDISHQQGSDVVASMVVFTNGVSNKGEYRKFKTHKNHNDDFYNMHETLSRRLSDRNYSKWDVPSLILIDGGKGQLQAAIRARNESGHTKIPFIGLAKREEQIVIYKNQSMVELNVPALQKMGGFYAETKDFITVNLPHNTNLVKLLQRIRDESHRFAVSYHAVLKVKRQTASLLDDVPGIGPATRKRLIKNFGSLRGVKEADQNELTAIVGSAKAKSIKSFLG